MSDPLVPVEGVACPCPGLPHPDGDTVFLLPKLGLFGGALAQRKIIEAINNKADRDEIMAALTEAYVRYGVAAWSFVDADGKPLELNPENIKSTLLDDFSRGSLVADKADDLYIESLLSPLRPAASKSSPPTPIGDSTPPKRRSSPKRQKR